MAQHRKTPVKSGAKCKTTRPPKAPPSPFHFSWCGRFLASAETTGDVAAALLKEGVSVVQYRRARRADPAFNAACADVDLSVRESIQGNLELAAAAGNVGAARLLARGLGPILTDGPDELEQLPPHVAAAMIEAGLRAYERGK